MTNNLEDVWLNGIRGEKRYPFRPVACAEDFSIFEYATSLAMKCRFNGLVKEFFSVAEHCVLLSYLDEACAPDLLVHEFDEWLLPDVPSPTKRTKEFAFLRPFAHAQSKSIRAILGLPVTEPARVNLLDKAMIGVEAEFVFYAIHPDWQSPLAGQFEAERTHYRSLLKGWSPQEARLRFLLRFSELFPHFSIDFPQGFLFS